MAGDLWWIPLAAGLKDGINPCLLITAALILLGLLWFKKVGINQLWVLLLMVSIILSSFLFNCGFLEKIVLNKSFQFLARGVYVVLSIGVGLQGFKFLKQWYSLSKGNKIAFEGPIKIKAPAIGLIFFLILIGFLLSLLSSLWPVNYYIMVFSIYMMMPGQLISLGSLIFIYTVLTLWVVYMVIFVPCLEVRNQRLFKIIAAAIFLSASLSIIDIVFMKG